MTALKGVFPSTKKNGTVYYRASITYKNKHLSLGSYVSPEAAHQAYSEAHMILHDRSTRLEDYAPGLSLSFEKWIVLHNFGNNGYYFKSPIYLRKYYFSYYLDPDTELFFDVEDLFYYANHKIIRREGYLFVNDFGIQTNILSRYGIKNFAVEGRDYRFKDENPCNFRYHNLEIINPYTGVERIHVDGHVCFKAKIHVNGNWLIGSYRTAEQAAVAYNKAADFLNAAGICLKNYSRNYIESYSSNTYHEVYNDITLPEKFTKKDSGT